MSDTRNPALGILDSHIGSWRDVIHAAEADKFKAEEAIAHATSRIKELCDIQDAIGKTHGPPTVPAADKPPRKPRRTSEEMAAVRAAKTAMASLGNGLVRATDGLGNTVITRPVTMKSVAEPAGALTDPTAPADGSDLHAIPKFLERKA